MAATSDPPDSPSRFALGQAERLRRAGRLEEGVATLAADAARQWAMRMNRPRPGTLNGGAAISSSLEEAVSAQRDWLEKAEVSAARDYLSTLIETMNGEGPMGPFMSSASMTNVAVTALTARLRPSDDGKQVSILDLASGAGGTLRAAADALQAKGYQTRVLGQEINHDAAQIGAANLFLSGVAGEIQVADSLTTDAFPDTRVDYAISQPPFGLNWQSVETTVHERNTRNGWYRDGLPQRNDSTWLFVSRLLDKLKTPEQGGGRAVIFVAAGALFQSGSSAIRRAVLHANVLEAVVGLPSGVAPAVAAPLYALVFSNVKPKNRQDQIQLIDLRAYFETSRQRLLSPRDMRGDAIDVLARALDTVKPTAVARMRPVSYFTRRRYTVRRSDGAGAGRAESFPSWDVDVPASETADAFLSARYAPIPACEWVDAGSQQTQITLDETFDSLEVRVRVWLREQRWTGTRLSQLLVAEPRLLTQDASDIGQQAVLLPTGNGDVAVGIGQTPGPGRWLELQPDTELVSPDFLASWLNSPMGRTVRQRAMDRAATGAVIRTVRSSSRRDLMRYMDELVVPLPSRVMQDELADADAKLRAVATLTDSARAQVWTRPSARKEIVARFDPLFDESFSNWSASLPYPVAAALWTLESKSNNLDAVLKQMLLVWESYIIFTGTVLFSALGQDPALLQEVVPVLRRALERERLTMERATIGSWNVIVMQLSARFRRLLMSDDPDERARILQLFGGPSADTLGKLISTEVVGLFDDTNAKRNAWSGHSGTVPDTELRDRVAQLTDKLNELRVAVGSAWSDLQLVRAGVASLKGGEFTQEVEIAVGSNTPFRRGGLRVGKMMEAGELYLATDGAAQPLQLEHFLVLRASPDHVRDTAYFYNRLDGHQVRMVCYHLADRGEVTEPMDDVFSAVTSLLGS